jgi:hypothetical protein
VAAVSASQHDILAAAGADLIEPFELSFRARFEPLCAEAAALSPRLAGQPTCLLGSLESKRCSSKFDASK